MSGLDAPTGSAAQAPAPAPAPARGAQGTVRRIIVFTILFVLVCLTATGVAGLLGRLLETRPEFGEDPGGLALSLAYTLIGGPLAALLWWLLWRRLDGPDRASVAWGLYLSAVSIVSLVTFTTSLLAMFADLIAGRWAPDALATAIAWLAVWVAHRLMWAHPGRGPLRLTSVPVVLGAAFGLIIAASGAITVLSVVFDAAGDPAAVYVGAPWWRDALQGLVWAAGGSIVWWWHWRRDGARGLSRGFADVVLVLIVLGSAAVALGGIGTALYVGLRALFDRDAGWPVILDPLGLALAAASVGTIVWLYHRIAAADRRTVTRDAARLVEAGVGLAGAASGIGVIVNALLASLSAPLAGPDARALLLGGIASLVVGAPVWWAAWRPGREATDAGTAGRRVYLVAVFGLSAIVAIIAVLFIGYRLFESALDSGGRLIERIRAPFGLLVATALVAGYHFAVWRRDRESAPAAPARTIDRVVLVAGGDASAVEHAVREATGASVTVWRRADAAAAPEAQVVVSALAGVATHRVLVVASQGGGVDVVPLAD